MPVGICLLRYKSVRPSSRLRRGPSRVERRVEGDEVPVQATASRKECSSSPGGV